MPDGAVAQAQGKTFTQAEVDALLGQRAARERDKFADYDELKKKAEAFDAAQEASASELDRMRKRAEKAEAQAAQAAAREKHAELVKRIAAEHGVEGRFTSLLTAQTEEGLIEQAKLIGERFAAPVPSDTGRPAAVADPDAEGRNFARNLFAGKR